MNSVGFSICAGYGPQTLLTQFGVACGQSVLRMHCAAAVAAADRSAARSR